MHEEMRAGLQVWLMGALSLAACGNWPYGGLGEPEPQGLIEPEKQIAEPEPDDATCKELRVGIGYDTATEVGRAADSIHWVEGFHTGDLVWSNNGRHSRVTIDVWNVRPTLVRSRVNQQRNVVNYDVTCATHIELVANVEFATDDGRIFYETELTLRAYGGVEAFGKTFLPWDVLGDHYAPVVNGRCFQGLELKVLLGDTGFSGALTNDFTQGACDNPSDKHLTAVAGHWGSRWQSY